MRRLAHVNEVVAGGQALEYDLGGELRRSAVVVKPEQVAEEVVDLEPRVAQARIGREAAVVRGRVWEVHNPHINVAGHVLQPAACGAIGLEGEVVVGGGGGVVDLDLAVGGSLAGGGAAAVCQAILVAEVTVFGAEGDAITADGGAAARLTVAIVADIKLAVVVTAGCFRLCVVTVLVRIDEAVATAGGHASRGVKLTLLVATESAAGERECGAVGLNEARLTRFAVVDDAIAAGIRRVLIAWVLVGGAGVTGILIAVILVCGVGVAVILVAGV